VGGEGSVKGVYMKGYQSNSIMVQDGGIVMLK